MTPLSDCMFFHNQHVTLVMGGSTMSATSTLTSYSATLCSLNTSFLTKKGSKRTQRNHHLFAVMAVLAIVVFAGFFVEVAQAQNAGKAASNSDIMRQDLLRFVGPVTDQIIENASVPGDSYLVRLNRRNGQANSTDYGMLVRGMDAVEIALLEDARDGKWDHFDLFHAAMVVEGVRDLNQIQAYEAKLNAVVAGVRADSKNELARKLFEALHRDILTKPYDTDCTQLGQVFETGHFNCVSATVLFNILADKAGLVACALEMPGHALSRVQLDGVLMNIETTAPNWFSLPTATARNAATLYRVAKPALAQPLPPTASRQGNAVVDITVNADDLAKNLREITPVQLIATIYYNQGVDHMKAGRYAEAAMANIKALHLDPNSDTAWGNLMATINNWALELTKTSKRPDHAARLLDQGVYLDSTYDKFQANQLHVYYNWINDLASEGRVADAQKVFAIACQRLPGNHDLVNLMQRIEKN